MKIVYMSNDNKIFSTEEECKNYEDKLIPSLLTSKFYDENSIILDYSNLKDIKNKTKWIDFKTKDLVIIEKIFGAKACYKIDKDGIYFKEDDYFIKVYGSYLTLKILQNNRHCYARFIECLKNVPKFEIVY